MSDPKYKIGDRLVLKENFIIVEIAYAYKNKYEVFYPHLTTPKFFTVKEDELMEKPPNYAEKIFELYLEYRHKYYDLLDKLYTPNYRERY